MPVIHVPAIVDAGARLGPEPVCCGELRNYGDTNYANYELRNYGITVGITELR